MKKYSIYVFLLAVIIFGFFGSVTITHAQSSGYCSITPIVTQSGCINAGGTWTSYASSNNAVSACAALDTGIGKILCQIGKILNSIVPLLLALGLIYFIWGVVQYVIGGDGESKAKGRDQIIYGLIGLSVIVGVWGLVNIVINTFGLKGAPQVALVPVTDTSCKTLPNDPRIQDLLCYITGMLNDAVIPLIFALAVILFLWGVVQFVINSDDEAKKTKGKNFMLWGIIALTVMVSVWGLVNILASTFHVNTSFIPQVKP